MKTRGLLLVVLLLLTTVGSRAQPPRGEGPPSHEQMESARIAFITSRLDLTPRQAQVFWPLYNEMEGRRAELREQLREQHRQDRSSMTDAEAEAMLDDVLAMRQQELALEIDYYQRMQEVLSAQQVLKLMRAEEEFREVIIREIRQRRRDEREGRDERRDSRHEGRGGL